MGSETQQEKREDTHLIEALETFIPHIMRQSGTPGLNLALARYGEVIWEAGFGYADLDQEMSMTSTTVFHSGSMGKLYTATAVMQLVEQGVIGLYDPINKYLKEFRVINPLGEREITFYDLLTHRSGLTSNMAGSDFNPPPPLGEHLKEGYAQKTFRPYQGSLLPRWSAKVGERFQYSNFGLATLGYLVQVTNPEGLSFPGYVQQHIMDPLGMTSSQFPPVQDAHHVRSEIFERFSTGYARFGPVHLPTPAIYFADYPAGTVVSTPGDHIRLLLALMNEGRYNGYQMLKPETVRMMLTSQLTVPGHPVLGAFGQGLIVRLFNVGAGDACFGHSGSHMYGWANDSRAYPQQDFALVVATNHWDMVSDSERYGEARRIAQFISTWLKREKVPSHAEGRSSSWVWRPCYRVGQDSGPVTSWAWKVSYVIGLIIVEQMKGGLGIQSPLKEQMVEAMATGAKVQTEAESGVPVWDPEGFRAGAKDMLATEMTPGAIQAFLESERLQMLFEELPLLYRELGAKEGVLIPWLKTP